ncbi:FtsX-like permease family protein [Parasulfuritortus cantonensis]|uniref:FtsX-like permease family protein n=1 Tax=Parasulfuritortus cantonensis TaxID=2528202 RepID=A0A4R1B836_9PROT|nr:FtsX-like permease family protein [Parasulfuritortus cantonensis]TCJ13427.1 FtsX-like permease family protein [Parasulfuritortus cantonensis]
MTGARLNDLRLALRLLVREWRGGEVRILLAVVALAVASLTAVAFVADRVRLSLAQEADALLAADLVLSGDRPLDPAFQAEARRRGLAVARSATFLSMAQGPSGAVLAGIKAASPGYPLRGRLRVADAPYGPDRPATGLPGPGRAWVDARLATELRLRVGDTVRLGARDLAVTAILSHESERSGNFMALAPRLLVAEADLAGTGLVQEGSRIAWRLFVAGPPEALAGFRAWATPRLGRGQKLEGLADARPELRQVLDKAERYLGLAALLAVVLAAAAAQMILRRYAQRHFDQFALLRCFGASRARLIRLYLAQFAGLGLAAGLLGGVAGFLVQWGLAALLADVLRLDLAAPSWRPFGLGLGAGLLIVVAFGLPAMRRLAEVPALRVLRRDLGPARSRQVLAQLLALAVLAGLLVWQAGDLRLGAIVVGGLVAAGLAAGLAIRALLAPLAWLAHRLPPAPRLGLLALRRRGWETTLQVMALSLGLLALLLLTLVRGDLLAAWRDKIPADAPNRFAINIQPDQVAPIRAWLAGHGVPDAELYPMVRGRLTAIAGRPVAPEAFPEERARHLAEREFNLSALAALPADNVVSAGRWWQAGARNVFSVEEGIAKTLGIRLGDRLDFDAGGLPLSGVVTSLRKVEWDSFRVNFFVVGPPGSLAGLPASYITAFRLAPARATVLAELVAAWPNVTVIDVDAVMTEMRTLMDRISLAVQVVFLFSLAVGLLVMVAALYARRDERAREIGVWRALGASAHTVRIALATEFAALGLLSGAVAAGAASALAWLLAERVFELPHAADPAVWLAGLAVGLALVLAVGLAASRGLVAAPPMAALRDAD